MFGVFFLGFRQSFQIVWSSWFEKKGAVVPIVELPNTNKISIYIIYLHIFLYTDIYQSIFIYVFIHIYIYIFAEGLGFGGSVLAASPNVSLGVEATSMTGQVLMKLNPFT